MQFVVVVVDVKDVEFALTIAAIPVTILILVMAGYFTRKESLSGMIATIVSSQHQVSIPAFTDRAWLSSFTLEEWLTFFSNSCECISIPTGPSAMYLLAKLSLLSL